MSDTRRVLDETVAWAVDRVFGGIALIFGLWLVVALLIGGAVALEEKLNPCTEDLVYDEVAGTVSGGCD